jgi:hypothetical protein
MFERRATVEQVQHPVYPKDQAAPLCGCFGLTADDVQADIDEGGVRRVKELLAKAKMPEAHCLTKAVSGQCCVADVQRYFMKLRSGE